MSHHLPLVFIVLGALALVATLYFFWQSLRGAMVPEVSAALVSEPVSRERAALLHEKQALLVALRDLDSEREAGKLSQEDFTQLSGQYRARAREVLRSLDAQLAPHRPAAQALIARARGASAGGSVSVSAKPPAADGGHGMCRAAECGTKNEPDAVFCKKCGARLVAEQGA